jgi:hypothetical protein
MFEGLCDDGVSYSLAHRIRAAREALHPNGVGAGPLQLAHSLWKASATVASAATLVARGAVELGVDLVFPTSRSALDGPASSLRRYSTARVPMHDIAQVCQRFDVTVNDVVLAAITESYRAMMIDRGERPRRESLRTLLPVSMGSVQAPQLIDDAVSLMLADLPVDEGNLVQRLRAVHSRLDDTAPRGGGSTTRLPHQDVAATVTPVPGPRQQLHLMGRTVLSLFPIAPIATNLRTGIAILSYADDLFFGVFADYDTVPEVDTVAHGIELAVARLVSCSRHPSTPQTPERPKTPRDPHKLTSLGTG